jgi:hypothetical protein
MERCTEKMVVGPKKMFCTNHSFCSFDKRSIGNFSRGSAAGTLLISRLDAQAVQAQAETCTHSVPVESLHSYHASNFEGVLPAFVDPILISLHLVAIVASNAVVDATDIGLFDVGYYGSLIAWGSPSGSGCYPVLRPVLSSMLKKISDRFLDKLLSRRYLAASELKHCQGDGMISSDMFRA